MDYDVIVVGGGGAGLSAAIMAAQAGARVLVLEAGERVGGSTALSGGVFYAAATSVQRARGIEDDPLAMFRFYMTINQYKIDPAMVRTLCQQCAGALEWLISLGVDFPPENLYSSSLDGAMRGHRAAGRGEEIIEVLDRVASGHPGIDIVVRSRVSDLVAGLSGGVAGVVLDGESVAAKAVVLATGGFSANRELLARLAPRMTKYGDWVRNTGARTSLGEGLVMGEKHGAVITGHDHVSMQLTPNFSKDFEPYMPEWLIWVDARGLRFIDETVDYSISPKVVDELPEHQCFAIFDEAARLVARQHVAVGDAKRIYDYSSWSGERLAEMADQGRVFRADTLENLAEMAGIHGPALVTTVERVNADYNAGVEDTQCFKPIKYLKPILTPPFYAVLLRPSVVGTTCAGLRCDPACHVLGQDGRPIPGLYAAGETVGNVIGERYAGGGNSIANAITFGRIAGSNAAARR